jgi:hypothetical protein
MLDEPTDLPEGKLSQGFRERKLLTWIERIPAARRRSMVATRIGSMLEHATVA